MCFDDRVLSISRKPLDGQIRTSSVQSAIGCIESTTKFDLVLFLLLLNLCFAYSFLGSVGKYVMKCTSILDLLCMPPGCSPCLKMLDKLFTSVMWKIPETYDAMPAGTVAAILPGSRMSMLLWPLAARTAYGRINVFSPCPRLFKKQFITRKLMRLRLHGFKKDNHPCFDSHAFK